MNTRDLAGVYPPMVTPFRDDEVDYEAIRFNVDRWMTTGLRGVLALGSNGESGSVDEDEAERVIAAARERVPRDRVLLAGTGRQSTRAAIRATARAARAGADAVLVLTPYFFRAQMTHEALVAHYRAVADASPIPVLLYNFTTVTAMNLPPDTVAALAGHPNIVGIKDSNGDLAQLSAIIAKTPPDFAVFGGSAPVLFPSLVVGAAGGILAVANCAPEACVAIYDAVRAGRLDEARARQRRLTPLAAAVTAQYGVGGLKAAMTLAGYRGGDVRAPLLPAPPTAHEHLTQLLEALRS